MARNRKVIKDQALIQKCLDERWYPLQRGIQRFKEKGCLLCEEYGCNDCPIGIDTGEAACSETPYNDAEWEITERENGEPYDQEPIDNMVEYLEGLIFRIEDLYNGE